MEKQFHQYAGYAKIILPAFIIILIFTGSSFSQSAVKPGGDGSTGTPYQISSLENLYWLSLSDSVWDKHFVQTANIDASSTISWDDGDGGDAEGAHGLPGLLLPLGSGRPTLRPADHLLHHDGGKPTPNLTAQQEDCGDGDVHDKELLH